jgi:peptide/nickel transport system permease protein
MLVFVIRRVLISIPVLIASTILTFVIVKLSGDPLTPLKQRQSTASPEAKQRFIDQETHRLWLDRSWPEQYWHWISNVLFHNNWWPWRSSPVSSAR